MARIRNVEIENFRGIRKRSWFPSECVNCLKGPGDIGKSSILEAINFCLGARRNLSFSDDDFHRPDVETHLLAVNIARGCRAKNADSLGSDIPVDLRPIDLSIEVWCGG